ncbi:MAG: molybdenum-dependent transcriptional regulator [Thiobacillus sp. 65-29]|nr:MAG: molybdenum-dependent transcriptional regulator [Thiobacillus sp. 65-29]
MHLVGRIHLDTDEGVLLAGQRVRLLEAIERHGSIQKAAKEVDLSYKSAWEAVNAMNNLCDPPLVQREVGGRRGGGSRLTEHGRNMVSLFRAVEAEYQRALDKLGGDLGDLRNFNRLLNRFSMKTSARNQFHGTITALIQEPVNFEVRLRLDDWNEIVAVVTHASAEHLELRVGMPILALVKAPSVLLLTDPQIKVSTRNTLWGTVYDIRPGPVNAEVTVALPSGKTVIAVITRASCEDLGLAVGTSVCAAFKSSSVILAVMN